MRVDAPAERGCANETISLRNVGRETESFLWYINQRYHSLASYTLFTQALSMAPEVRDCRVPHCCHHAAVGDLFMSLLA